MAEIAKYMIKKDWKDFKLNLNLVANQLASIVNSFCGLQAHSYLEFWFKEEPSEEEKSLIDLYWDDLTESSEEAVRYYSEEQFQSAIQAIKHDALLKTFDELSVAQKKLLMNLVPTPEELGFNGALKQT